jgi:hypothetical protein
MTFTEPTRRIDALKRRWRFRSAVTGQFVPRWRALLFPNTTVKERVR